MWVVEIDGWFWVKFKTRALGRWTRNCSLATPVTTKEARVYRRDWKSEGVKLHRVPAA